MLHLVSSIRGRIFRVLAVLLVSCVLVSCGGSKGPKRMLQLKIYPNDAFILYLSGDFRIDITLEGAPIMIGGRSESAYKFDVTSVDPEGNIEFKVTAQSIIHPSIIAPLGPALKGETFTMHMAPDGTITGFEGTESVRKNVSEKLEKVLASAVDPNKSEEELQSDVDAYRADLVGMLDDDNLRGLFEPIFRVWPSTPVTDGDTWHRESIPMRIQFDGLFADSEFRVESWNDGEVRLTCTSVVKALDSNPLNTLSGNSESEITIDGINGFVKTVYTRSDIKGTYVFNEGEDPRPVTVHEEVFVELLRL